MIQEVKIRVLHADHSISVLGSLSKHHQVSLLVLQIHKPRNTHTGTPYTRLACGSSVIGWDA